MFRSNLLSFAVIKISSSSEITQGLIYFVYRLFAIKKIKKTSLINYYCQVSANQYMWCLPQIYYGKKTIGKSLNA